MRSKNQIFIGMFLSWSTFVQASTVNPFGGSGCGNSVYRLTQNGNPIKTPDPEKNKRDALMQAEAKKKENTSLPNTTVVARNGSGDVFTKQRANGLVADVSAQPRSIFPLLAGWLTPMNGGESEDRRHKEAMHRITTPGHANKTSHHESTLGQSTLGRNTKSSEGVVSKEPATIGKVQAVQPLIGVSPNSLEIPKPAITKKTNLGAMQSYTGHNENTLPKPTAVTLDGAHAQVSKDPKSE